MHKIILICILLCSFCSTGEISTYNRRNYRIDKVALFLQSGEYNNNIQLFEFIKKTVDRKTVYNLHIKLVFASTKSPYEIESVVFRLDDGSFVASTHIYYILQQYPIETFEEFTVVIPENELNKFCMSNTITIEVVGKRRRQNFILEESHIDLIHLFCKRYIQ